VLPVASYWAEMSTNIPAGKHFKTSGRTTVQVNIQLSATHTRCNGSGHCFPPLAAGWGDRPKFRLTLSRHLKLLLLARHLCVVSFRSTRAEIATNAGTGALSVMPTALCWIWSGRRPGTPSPSSSRPLSLAPQAWP
jgi:hypothetical protein